MTEPTRGPWAADITRFRNRVITTSGQDIADCGTHEDARWIANARTEEPQLREDLARARADLHEARVAAEHAGNEHREECRRLAMAESSALLLRDKADHRASRAEAAVREMSERLAAVEAELARLRPLGAAIERWVRYRYSPELLASWDAYQASFKE